MSLKSWLSGIVDFIGKMFKNTPNEVKKVLPFVSTLLNNMKTVIGSQYTDILTAVIPGDADDKLIAMARLWLPKVALQFELLSGAVQSKTGEEAFQKFLTNLHLSDDDTKDIVYKGLVDKFIQAFSDGKLTFAESAMISEYFFQYVYKKK